MRSLPKLVTIAFLFQMILSMPTHAAAQAAKSPDPKAVSVYNLGLNSFKIGSTEAAIIFFKRAADIDPNLADAHYNIGVIFLTQRRYKEAVPRFNEVLRIKPNDPEALLNLGKCLLYLGKFQEAKQKLLSIAPNSSHFKEAQELVKKCDQGQPATPQPTLRAPAQPTSHFRPAQTPAVTSNQATTPQSVYRPAAQSKTVAPQTPTTTTPAQNTQYEAPVAGQPTAILANTTVRVIATGFNSPSGLTFDKFGNLYVANYSKNSVDRISRDGTKKEFSAGGNLKGPIGLAADEVGNIYVANYLGGTIAKITPAGISTIIATGFKKPYYLILDKGKNLFVSQQEDNSIIRVSLPK